MARPSVEAERRDQILRATCRVIAERGLPETRVADVATLAGVSTGTVHYYFPTKKALLHAAFDHNFQDSLARREEYLSPNGHPHDHLAQFIESYLPVTGPTAQAWKVWVELWTQAIHDPDLRALNDRIYARWRATVAEVIGSAQADGSLRAGDAVEYANALIGLLDGLAIQVMLGSTALSADDMRRICRGYINQLRPGT